MTTIWVIRRDTRSSDYSSHGRGFTGLRVRGFRDLGFRGRGGLDSLRFVGSGSGARGGNVGSIPHPVMGTTWDYCRYKALITPS